MEDEEVIDGYLIMRRIPAPTHSRKQVWVPSPILYTLWSEAYEVVKNEDQSGWRICRVFSVDSGVE